jgi:hypothetical protein
MISYPLTGPAGARGKSTTALEQAIRQKLAADYLQSPSVTVTVKEFVKRRVFIVGGVTKPDGYEMSHEARMTVLQPVRGGRRLHRAGVEGCRPGPAARPAASGRCPVLADGGRAGARAGEDGRGPDLARRSSSWSPRRSASRT